MQQFEENLFAGNNVNILERASSNSRKAMQPKKSQTSRAFLLFGYMSRVSRSCAVPRRKQYSGYTGI